jgi:hypothetical protein
MRQGFDVRDDTYPQKCGQPTYLVAHVYPRTTKYPCGFATCNHFSDFDVRMSYCRDHGLAYAYRPAL